MWCTAMGVSVSDGLREVAAEPADMNLPGFQLHPLRGDLAGFWAVSVSGNWRITFRFEAGNVRDMDLVDYH